MVDFKTDWERHEFDLNGETVAMELKPLGVRAFLALMRVDTESPNEDQIDVMQFIFENYTRSYENLTVNGEPMTAEQLVNLAPLIGFCGKVMERLTSISELAKEDEKN